MPGLCPRNRGGAWREGLLVRRLFLRRQSNPDQLAVRAVLILLTIDPMSWPMTW
jgi:hypothetical protein